MAQRSDRIGIGSCLVAFAAMLVAPPIASQEPAGPRLVGAESLTTERGRFALRDAEGRRVGWWTLTEGSARVSLAGAELGLPPLQRWYASADGRTLVGAGDARMPEHPFELEVRIWRDGVQAEILEEHYDPESELILDAEGTLALVGQRAGERGQPRALVVRPDGTRYEHALEAGTLARDPVLYSGALLLRAQPVRAEGGPGRIVRVDALGTATLFEAPLILGLHGFQDRGWVLVHLRQELACIDATSGRRLWSRPVALRPAGRSAWALWPSPRGDVVALVTAPLRRRGAPAPEAPRLELLDARDGGPLAVRPLVHGGPPGSIIACADGTRLVVEGMDWREVLAW